MNYDEYTRLKLKLEEYLIQPDVNLSKDIISAYDLYQIVDNKLQELRDIKLGDDFKNEINKGHIIRKVSSLFKKNDTCTNRLCTKITASSNGQKSSIFLCFGTPDYISYKSFLDICKDKDSDEIYFENYNVDKTFVEKHYERINKIFDKLEEFSSLYQNNNGGKQDLSDDFFDITLEYDSFGRTNIYIKISQYEDKEKIYEREWLKRQKLSDFVLENKEAILSKIPINISKLNYTTRTIVEEAINKINGPQLVKKR